MRVNLELIEAHAHSMGYFSIYRHVRRKGKLNGTFKQTQEGYYDKEQIGINDTNYVCYLDWISNTTPWHQY